MPGRELLFSVKRHEFRVDTFRAGGKGGQHQNKTDSAVRITHPASGAVGESREHRSQHRNRGEAFRRLLAHPKWKVWLNLRVTEILSRESIEQTVERMMRDVTVEYRDARTGRWVPEATSRRGGDLDG